MAEDEEEKPTFESLGLSPDSCAALRRIGWILPGSFLVKALPDMLSGMDVSGKVRDIAAYGKTNAYLLTMLEKFRHRVPHGGGVRALILIPTRDLACFIFNYAEKLIAFTDIVISLLVGGDNMESQLEILAQKPPDAIFATLDTLIQHLSLVDLSTVELLVIDGAKELFATPDHLNQILDQLNENRQTLLFTTFRTAAVVSFIRTSMRDAKHVVVQSELYKKMNALNQSLMTLGLDNNLQGPPSPTQCSNVNATNKKRAVHDGMEEVGNSKRRAENSMDED